MHRSINSWLCWLGGGTTRDLCHPLKANFVLPNSNLLKSFGSLPIIQPAVVLNFLRGDDEGCCSYRDLCYSYSDLMLFLHLFLCEEEIGNGSSSLSPWKLRASQEQLRRVELAFLLMPCVVILLEIESSRYTIRKVQTQYIHLEEGTQRSSKKGRLAARGREAAGGSQ